MTLAAAVIPFMIISSDTATVDTTTSTVNNLKYNGAKFSVSSAGTDADGNKFLNLKVQNEFKKHT